MDHDDATIGTILSRREALGLVGRGALGLSFGSLAALSEAGYQEQARRDVRLVAAPALTEGPFFVDEKLNRSNLIGETTRQSVVAAVPLALNLKVLKLDGGKFSPVKGVTVDIWHADAVGVYSDESNPMNHEDTAHQTWLRGYQLSDANGVTKFKTIVPGWYGGRTAHIHFKIRIPGDSSHKEFTSQLFFHESFSDSIFAHPPYLVREGQESRNDTDGIFSERQADGTVAGEHLTLDVVPNTGAKGYRADFTIALTQNSFSARRGRGFGGPPPPPWDGGT